MYYEWGRECCIVHRKQESYSKDVVAPYLDISECVCVCLCDYKWLLELSSAHIFGGEHNPTIWKVEATTGSICQVSLKTQTHTHTPTHAFTHELKRVVNKQHAVGAS